MKTSNLDSIIEFQRQQIAQETNITGRCIIGTDTGETDPATGRILIKDLTVIAYKVNRRAIGRSRQLILSQERNYLQHAWIYPDLIFNGEGCEILAIVDVDEYTRQDGTSSYGFIKLHKYASLTFNIAQDLYLTSQRNTGRSLEVACDKAEEYINRIADAIDEDKGMCMIYFNPRLLALLIRYYKRLRAKVSKKQYQASKKSSKKVTKKGFGKVY